MSIIHDLGYKRYIGTRRSPSTRWLVIMRHQIATGWKKWWRYKLALGMAFITVCIAGGLMYFATNKVVRSIGGANDVMMTMADLVVPLSFKFFCTAAFVLSLSLGSTVVANDTQSGAFTFYFVRSIRPRDYVIGKLAGYGVLVATIVIIGPLLLVGMRLGLSSSTDELLDHLSLLPKMLALGVLATMLYTTVPLAISALLPNRRFALALWAAYYIIVGGIFTLIGITTHTPIGAMDLQTGLQSVMLNMFDLKMLGGGPNLDMGLIGVLIVMFVQVAVAIGVLWFQVSRDQKTGVGGSS
ncbi:MAG TPA: ABC transporter permease subunit [Kofleriaceae bacterium]|nr:ABC transporter permease subunit [Kofleriaceae bacterium]